MEAMKKNPYHHPYHHHHHLSQTEVNHLLVVLEITGIVFLRKCHIMPQTPENMHIEV
jgi:hypothetical protein